MINTIINAITKLLNSDFDKYDLTLYYTFDSISINFIVNGRSLHIQIVNNGNSITYRYNGAGKVIKLKDGVEKYELLKLVEQLKEQYQDYVDSKFKLFVSGQYDNNEDNEIDQ